MRTVTDDMLIERCDSEAARAETKATTLRLYGLDGFAVLFDRATLFWLDLSFSVMTGLPLTREQQFVLTFVRKELAGDTRAWPTDKRSLKRAAA